MGYAHPVPQRHVAEHLNTRRNCGLFDVSHMGRLIVEGPQRVAFLQKVLSNNVEALPVGRAQYCIIPAPDGSAVDDAYLYRFEADRYLLVVNASNTDKDLAHFAAIVPAFDCTITDITGTSALPGSPGPQQRTTASDPLRLRLYHPAPRKMTSTPCRWRVIPSRSPEPATPASL